jgi:hypothetical protein
LLLLVVGDCTNPAKVTTTSDRLYSSINYKYRKNELHILETEKHLHW